MPVTKKDISAIFGVSPAAIERVGSKQLFIIVKDSKQFLISYHTIVGVYSGGCWLLTLKKYSVTTSKQLSQFPYANRRISNEELIALLPDHLKHYAR